MTHSHVPSLSPFSQSVTLTALLYDRTPLHTTQGVDKPTTSFVFLAISFRLLTYRSGSSILESSGSLNLAYVVLILCLDSFSFTPLKLNNLPKFKQV